MPSHQAQDDSLAELAASEVSVLLNRDETTFERLARSRVDPHRNACSTLDDLAQATNVTGNQCHVTVGAASTASPSHRQSNPISTQPSQPSNRASDVTPFTVPSAPSERELRKRAESLNTSLRVAVGSRTATTSSTRNGTGSESESFSNSDLLQCGALFDEERRNARRRRRHKEIVLSDSEDSARLDPYTARRERVRVPAANTAPTNPSTVHAPAAPPPAAPVEVPAPQNVEWPQKATYMFNALVLFLIALSGFIVFGIVYTHFNSGLELAASSKWPFRCTTWLMSALGMLLATVALTVYGMWHSHGEHPRAAKTILRAGSIATTGYLAFFGSTAGLSCMNCLLVLIAGFVVYPTVEGMFEFHA